MPASPNPQPVRRCRWGHSTTPRQAEREGGGRSKEEKEATAEPDLAGARSAAPIGYNDIAARHDTASPRHGLASPLHHHPTTTNPTVSHLAETTSLAKWNMHRHDRNLAEALSSGLAKLVS